MIARPEAAVVVPFFDEEARLGETLRALLEQTDRGFFLVLVDNGSRDASPRIAREFAERSGEHGLVTEVVLEPRKGTGAAADTGFRHAIARGARWIARTDADCVPAPSWIAHIRRAIDEGQELVAGRIAPRNDEQLSALERAVVPMMVRAAEEWGRVLPWRRGPEFRCPYFLAAGNNLAITSELYLKAGGFPRTSIEELHEDRELSERARKLTSRAGVRSDVVVYNSIRRVRAYGFARTLLWYAFHGGSPAEVDVR